MRDAMSLCDATMPLCARIGTELAAVAIENAAEAKTTSPIRALVMQLSP
jgi:hypothetical protein